MKPRDWVSAVSALAAIAVAIFAVGGVLRGAQAAVAALVAVALAATALSQRGLARPSPLVVLLGLASALTAAQLLPLPDAILGALSPMNSALRADGTALMDVGYWPAVTSDVGATVSALISLLALLGLSIVTVRISAGERGRYRVTACIGMLCGLVALVTLVHHLLGMSELYGFYKPEYAEPQLLGPLLNANSLACLTAFGAVLAIGLAAHRRQPAWLRACWLLVVAMCGVVTVGTISRGATLAFLAGALVTIAVLIAQRFSAPERKKKARARFLSSGLPMSILGGCLVVLVIWSNAGNVEKQLSDLSFNEVHYSRSKFAAWRSASALLEESPWLGIGRGSFEATFTRVHEASGLATYAFLENEYLQAAIDWGLPGALLLAAAALWLAVVAARRWRDGALVAGSLGALVVVAMQSNVDFGLEFLGLAAPVTAIAATLAYVPLRDLVRPRFSRCVRVVHALALVGGAALLLTSLAKPLDEDRRELSQHPSLEAARASVQRHPLDYYGYAVAADLLKRANDPRAIRFLNHAMALHPTHPHLHRMAARMLFELGNPSQAAVEYAAALRTTADPRKLVAEIVATFPAEVASTALPTDYAEPASLVNLLVETAHIDVARMWLARVLALQPKRGTACTLLYTLAEHDDVAAAEIAARKCTESLPDYQSRLALAKLLANRNREADAIRLLTDVESWQSRREDKVDGWLLLCDAHRALGYGDEAKRCLRRLDASPDMLNERRAEIIMRIEAINHPATGSAAEP